MSVGKLLGEVERGNSNTGINRGNAQREPGEQTDILWKNLTDRAQANGVIERHPAISDNQIVAGGRSHAHGVPGLNALQTRSSFGQKKRATKQADLRTLKSAHHQKQIDNGRETGNSFAAVQDVGVAVFYSS